MDTQIILHSLRTGISNILTLEGVDQKGIPFVGGLRSDLPLRPTQKEAFEAWWEFLNDPAVPDEEKLTGYFEIPSGIGKTAFFAAILEQMARQHGAGFKSAIIEPRIELLGQTQREIERFAPSLKKDTGIYGGQHRQRHRSSTILTYNSWNHLTEKALFGAENTDFLISNEAHRGLSNRRVDSMQTAFGNATLRIAFTATGKFDDEKTVERTHKRRIYFKSLADGVRGDELAHYIHTQLYVIRVEAPEGAASTIGEDNAEDKENVNRKLRRAAWNQRALKIFFEGRDQVTGDLISDNQAAFFTDGTDHAEQLEMLLNSHPGLREKAISKGCKDVAIALHSYLNPTEQTQRLKDYRDGQYMALVVDEKCKEGFDHPPLKTIIDYQHGSLVDKAQILGRGTRRWWNEAKGRFEGMTFIDTVIYIGRSNPEEDRKVRGRALRQAVLASSVLEDTHVLSGRAKLERLGESMKRKGPPILEDDPDVFEYATLEEVMTVHAEIASLSKEDRIEITEEIRQALIEQKDRTRIGPIGLLKDATDIPAGLTAPMINGWLVGTVNTAKSDHLEYVLQKWGERDLGIISSEILLRLKKYREETGLGPNALLSDRTDLPEGLTINMVDFWLTGVVKTARKLHLDYIEAAWENCGYRKFTKEMAEAIRTHKKRTGIGTRRILNSKDIPAGLSKSLDNWHAGTTRAVRKDHWDFVILLYEGAVDKGKKIEVTEEKRKLLLSEFERTTIGAVNIASMKDKPTGLTPHVINTWLRSKAKTALKMHWDYVLNRYQELPSVQRIPVTDAILFELQTHKNRTGIGPVLLLQIMPNAPEGLNAGVIAGWFTKIASTARKDYLDWSLKSWRECDYAQLTSEQRAEIVSLKKTAGVGIRKLFKLAGKPEDLTLGKIATIIAGRAATARMTHIEWITKELRLLQNS